MVATDGRYSGKREFKAPARRSLNEAELIILKSSADPVFQPVTNEQVRFFKESETSGARSKTVIIGPVLPFRGGIAQHTTLLARALAEDNSCHIFSFTRLYPGGLYRGESDRDPDYQDHIEKNTEYVLDTLRPWTWISVKRRIEALKPDIVLVPWWTSFLAPLLLYLSWSLRRGGTEVVFLCHNIVDHERAWWKKLLARIVLNQGSRFVTHTQVDAVRLRKLVPEASVTVQAHPIYDQFPAPREHLPRRAATELLFFGFVRPYKGLELLIEAMGLMAGEDVMLTIAGEFWEGEREIRERIADLGLASQIEIRSCYHTAAESATLFERADVVVLPYRNASGSGVVPLAYFYERPVIVTRVGGLSDVVHDGETGRIVPQDDHEALAAAIRTMDPDTRQRMRQNIVQEKRNLTWPLLARAVLGTAPAAAWSRPAASLRHAPGA